MRRSTNRILVSHAGTLPRPDDLAELFQGGASRRAEFVARLPSAVEEVVRHQAEIGIDVVNDGELSKLNFSHYARERLGGLEQPATGSSQGSARNIVARDARDYPEFHSRGGGRLRRAGTPLLQGSNVNPTVVCTGPLQYVGSETTALDVANLKSALKGLDVEGFLPAIAPGTIEHWLFNEYYKSDEEFLFAIADAMHQEYRAITDAGLNLQIDDPDLPDGWQMFPEMSVDDYRRYATLRVEALNHALRDIPEEQIRLHVCWGSGHGPHQNDIPLEHIVDIILSVKAQVYSVEAANPRHDHEWRVWREVKLPEGKSLMPGVIGHATDIIEHPRLVADRLVRYAEIVGKQNVIAGTDCGVGSRVFNGEIAWGKFAAMVEGARIASRELWD
ncbi:MAG TPA: cobalamin-independent methionine synthase II family protein [Chloroflexota bacterium]|jgi:5-methyltetrahydropteroyltriglutamate--homocysteine methyltransferase